MRGALLAAVLDASLSMARGERAGIAHALASHCGSGERRVLIPLELDIDDMAGSAIAADACSSRRNYPSKLLPTCQLAAIRRVSLGRHRRPEG